MDVVFLDVSCGHVKGYCYSHVNACSGTGMALLSRHLMCSVIPAGIK